MAVRKSKDGETVGITLRLPVRVLEAYEKIASKANMIDLKKNGKGGLSAQDVMRHRLASLPVLKTKVKD